jgi:hypothetical protein
MASKPIAIDLFCGLGGWTEGLLAEGYDVTGYDIEAHEYGDERYPATLVVRDVLTIHGSELAHADLIVASPPCQEYSYMAMPWGRAKQIARSLRGEDVFPEGYKGSRTVAELNALFDACFRIQREVNAIRAAVGLPPIPMVVENVKGAQPWVGRAAWNFGSYFLWGDIPALMPIQRYHQRLKVKAGEQWNVNRENFTGTRGWDEGLKAPGGAHVRDGAESTARLTNPAEGRKHHGDWFRDPDCPSRQGGQLKPPARVSATPPVDGRKGVGSGAEWFDQNISSLPSNSVRRKAASAKIAKIPFALSSHIARVYRPAEAVAA